MYVEDVRASEDSGTPTYGMKDLCDHWDGVFNILCKSGYQGPTILADILKTAQQGQYCIHPPNMEVPWQSLLTGEEHNPHLV